MSNHEDQQLEIQRYRMTLEQERRGGEVLDNNRANNDHELMNSERVTTGDNVDRGRSLASSGENDVQRRPLRFGSISQDLDRIPCRDVR